MTKEELENYEPKGELEGFPKEIISRMLDYQEEQGNPRDISVFERDEYSSLEQGGFDWDTTTEKEVFWEQVISERNFNLFFEKYPKQNNSQEFKVGDEVIDIITRQKGRIHKISTDEDKTFPIYVNFNEAESYTLDGRYYDDDMYPRLLHYRDDYDYSVIDFNNLPKRQEPKRWRAKKNGVYNFVSFDNECWFFSDDTKDDYDHFDNDNYNSGNYFCTEVEAEIIAQKLNTYFKQLIKEEYENKKH